MDKKPPLNVDCSGDVHVTPTFGKEHDASRMCWCRPDLDYTDPDTGYSVYVHRPDN